MKQFLFYDYDIEKSILNNLNRVIIYLILFLITIQILYHKLWKLFLDTNSFITIIWAIIVFWYWYKKYERDKELQLLKEYTEKYNILINKLYLERDRTNYRNLFNLFYEEFFLYSKWYISRELWDQWKYWIKSDLKREFKREEYKKVCHDIKNEKKWNSDDFFKHLFKKSWEKTNLKVNWKSFYEYFKILPLTPTNPWKKLISQK
jgi:hypothetical protein